MPVPYGELEFDILLKNQLAYDLVDSAGRELYRDWDILKFEKSVYGGDFTKWFFDDEDKAFLTKRLAKLDQSRPFLRFREAGTHYANELFFSDPDCGWGLRGMPFFWAYAARQFTFDELPTSPGSVERKYRRIAEGLGVTFGGDDLTFIDRFAGGGMSSGCVDGKTVAEAAKTLVRRVGLYR